MPILSTHELAKNGAKLEYDEHEGVIRNNSTGTTTRFYQEAGVYAVPLLVKRNIPGNSGQGFGRQGESSCCTNIKLM